MIKKTKILLLTNKDSKNEISKILKNKFKDGKVTVKTYSKPGLKGNINFRKNYFDYIFNFRSFLILNTKILKMAKIASINFHPAPPKYRGRGGINYALYNEEKKFGVTVHLMDQKIDNGKIIRMINKNSMASIGVLSNPDNKNIKLGKAGRKRYLGCRPKVRGVVMNPVDHPHGGGEGRTSGGKHPVTHWGVSTKGKKTRSNKKTNTFIIRRRKK